MTLNEVRGTLLENNDFLILTHRHPDGDTVGSAAALCLALKAAGKRARLFDNPEISPKLRPFFELAPREGAGLFPVAVDFSAKAQACRGAEDITPRLFIDHHTGEWDVPGFRDETAGACGELILELCRELAGDKPVEYYDCVYLAVSTDTGGFIFSNCGEREHLAAAECIKNGCRHEAINKAMFILKSPVRIQNESEILSSARFFKGGRIALSNVSLEMLDRSTSDETDNLSSLLMKIEGVVCGILTTENRDGTLRVSVRSDPPVDCAALCRLFGGGGHVRAAGCNLKGREELDILLTEVMKLV